MDKVSFKDTDLRVEDGKVKIVWFRLPEKILIILLTYPSFYWGLTKIYSGFYILRGTEDAHLGSRIGWTRLLLGVTVCVACSHVWQRLFEKGRLVVEWRRFRDNVIPFRRKR